MNTKLKKSIQYIVMGAIAVLLLWFSFKDVNWSDFIVGLKSCRWEFVLLSMLIGALSYFLRSLRWRELLLPIDPSTKISTCFNAINICYIVNMVLPRVGELVRCGYITADSSEDSEGRKRASYDKVLGTMVVDRLWDVLSMGLIAVVVFLCLWNRFGPFFVESIFDPLSAKLDFSLGWVFAALAILLASAIYLIIRFRDKSRFCGKICSMFSGIGQGLSSCLHMKSWWKFLLYTLLVWCCYWMTSATILWAVQGMDSAAFSPELSGAISGLSTLNIWDALFLMMVGAISSLVPVPGGFGAFHYLVSMALMTVYGIPFEIAIIFATLSHESQTITQIIFGSAGYACETLRKRR